MADSRLQPALEMEAYGTVQTVLLGAVVSPSTGPAIYQTELQWLVGSWRLGGPVIVYVWFEYSDDPQECHPMDSLQTL
jgi:hypothetical protein